MKKFFSAVVISVFCLLSAAEVKTLTGKDFASGPSVSEKDGVITVSGKTELMMNEVIEIDPSKTYDFNVTFRSVNGGDGAFMPVLMQYDAKGRTISCGQVKVIGGTFTELLKPAKRGDKVLYVKDAKLWSKKRLLCIAFNAKEDYSDLPSRLVSYNTITDIIEENGMFKVKLATPLVFNAPVGGVRLHQNGSRMIYPLGGKLATGSWSTLKGQVSGQARNDFQQRVWAPGAVTAKLGFQVNFRNPDTVTEIKDIKIEIR